MFKRFLALAAVVGSLALVIATSAVSAVASDGSL
jgi:hypothetical protein